MTGLSPVGHKTLVDYSLSQPTTSSPNPPVPESTQTHFTLHASHECSGCYTLYLCRRLIISQNTQSSHTHCPIYNFHFLHLTNKLLPPYPFATRNNTKTPRNTGSNHGSLEDTFHPRHQSQHHASYDRWPKAAYRIPRLQGGIVNHYLLG